MCPYIYPDIVPQTPSSSSPVTCSDSLLAPPPSGVPARGRAPAAAVAAPRGSPQSHRHAAATLQGQTGEEAVRPDEAGGRMHPGGGHSHDIVVVFLTLSSVVFCVTESHQ